MKEQSHKHEMSAAVRGDFARLRARGVSTTIGVDEQEPPDAPGAPDEAGEAAEPPRRPEREIPERWPLLRLRRRR